MNEKTADGLHGVDGRYAWYRAAVALTLSTVGGIGLWSAVVFLPLIQDEFGSDRGGASLPYLATMVGFAAGGVLMGRLADRFGIFVPLLTSPVMLCVGYLAASQAGSLTQFILAQAVLIGFLGSSTTFGPLVADTSLWFARRRGIAIAIVASGNYLAGTVWPPILQAALQVTDWRTLHVVIGVVCLVTMIPLAFALRRRAPTGDDDPPTASISTTPGLRASSLLDPSSRRTVQILLVVAGIACCVAMSMPQVHIVAYCADLGFGAARGAEMLSVMLGLGVVSRLIFGHVADRIGGLWTLILGSTLQCLALLLYLPFDGLMSLFVVSAVFGLSQGGIVPSYALVIRDFFPAREAGTRISLVITATVAGMALGGWLSGEVYDLTGSYQAAFLHGIAWNLINMSIAFWLLARASRRAVVAA